MIPLTVGEMAELMNGACFGDREARVTGSAVIDSRAVGSGDLFVAFAGDHVDGHDFAESAHSRGATAVLGSRPIPGVPTVVVTDVQTALQDLARFVLAKLRDRITVIALTGSQGKTTVKDLMTAVLSGAGTTVSTQGSFNNEIGLPLTVLRADSETRFLILEMGARGIGHLKELTHVAPPDLALVLNVGTAHLGEFGNRANIAQAKGEIVDALDEAGIAVLNADDPEVAAMKSRTTGSAITFGMNDAADLRLSDVTLDDFGRANFKLTHGPEQIPVAMKLPGAHQAMNAAAVAAVAVSCGLSLEDCASALQRVSALSPWRMEMNECADGLIVINDAYNANPESMMSALETLTLIGARTGRRTIAVLGQMRELGDNSAHLHQQVGAATKDIDLLVAVGAESEEIVTGRSGIPGDQRHAVHLESLEEAIRYLRHNVGSNDVVLIKASRSIGLESIATDLLVRHGASQGGQSG